MIELFTAPTPNGWKVSVTLEELDLPYKTSFVNLQEGDQKKPEFLAVNPNGRIPAIVDHEADGLTIFESGAIMLYLAEKTGKLLPQDMAGKYEAMQWLMFQMGGIGPMMGQANVFYRYMPEKIPVAIERYQNESKRLMTVIDGHLGDREWLAADQFTLADIANWCWIRTARWSGVDFSDLPNLIAWMKRISARPACQRGIAVPFDVSEMLKDTSGDKAKAFAKEGGKLVQK